MQQITNYEQAKAANEAAGQHFYAVTRSQAFGLRMLEHTYPVQGGAFVIASLRRDRSTPRVYQVRYISGKDGRLHMLPDDANYTTSFGARSRAKTLALYWQHGCQICRAVGHTIIEECKA